MKDQKIIKMEGEANRASLLSLEIAQLNEENVLTV